MTEQELREKAGELLFRILRPGYGERDLPTLDSSWQKEAWPLVQLGRAFGMREAVELVIPEVKAAEDEMDRLMEKGGRAYEKATSEYIVVKAIEYSLRHRLEEVEGE